MKVKKEKFSINAPIEKVWEALVRETRTAVWKSAPVAFDKQNDFKCWIWERSILNTDWGEKENGSRLKTNSKRNSKKPIVVNLELRSIKSGTATVIEVEQEIVADVEDRESKRKWSDYFIEPLKLYLEAEYANNTDIEYHQGG